MTAFTPATGALGGLLIGLGASLLMLTNGKICGISGILSNAFSSQGFERRWRILFILGLCLGGLIAFYGLNYSFTLRSDLAPVRSIAAGLFVGIGTALGNGCTSGHGVCGIARLSPRSICATVAFMASGILTVWVLRHLIGVQA